MAIKESAQIQPSANANKSTEYTSNNGLVKKVAVLFPAHVNQLISQIRLKQFSIRTEQAYLNWLARYIAFHDMQDPANLHGPSIKAYLEYLVVHKNVASSTQNQALCALIFFY